MASVGGSGQCWNLWREIADCCDSNGPPDYTREVWACARCGRQAKSSDYPHLPIDWAIVSLYLDHRFVGTEIRCPGCTHTAPVVRVIVRKYGSRMVSEGE